MNRRPWLSSAAKTNNNTFPQYFYLVFVVVVLFTLLACYSWLDYTQPLPLTCTAHTMFVLLLTQRYNRKHEYEIHVN